MSFRSRSRISRALATFTATTAILCALGTLATAQEKLFPKWELYGGYSFLNPGADVHGTFPPGLFPVSSHLDWNLRGAGASATYNFTRHFGLTLDASDHWGTSQNRLDHADFSNLSVGPKITFRHSHLSPFLEVLIGDQRLYPEAFHHIDKLGVMGGGGLDVNLSKHFAWRLIRADYVASSYRFGPEASTPTTLLHGARLQTGVVFMFGGAPAVTPSATCSVQPTEVFAGDPVTATASGSNFNPKHTVHYAWSGTGVKVSGSGATAQVDTNGLEPGSYQVTANLSDGSRTGVASASASFTVKKSNPPTVSCSSSPATVEIGGSSTITATASSADGRRLTYSYASNGGSVTGNTSSAVVSTSGAQPGTITVICNVSDDRTPPLQASSTATVNVQAPPPPAPVERTAIEKRLALHSIYFATAKPTPEHPDGGLAASQEKTLIALAGDFKTYMQDKPDARLTLEGHADSRGSAKFNQALSERRVDRTKRFLVEHGVPEASIQTEAFGVQQELTDVEVKSAVERNPELSAEERQKLLGNMNTIVLASNRRVDITLSIAGQKAQQSVREYPFNASDSLALLDTENTGKTAKHKSTGHSAKKKTTKK
jgi:outer membrane protein OmpA-like peptidoglycan-associated protein